MYFICENVVKAPGVIIMCFELDHPVPEDTQTDKAYQFKSATVTSAKLVAVDPYGVITILYDADAENLPTLGTVGVMIDGTLTNLSPSASDAGMYEPGTTLGEAS